jgi:hypothetical protein
MLLASVGETYSMHRTDEKHSPEWKTLFERARPRWEDNTKVKHKGLEYGLYPSGSGFELQFWGFVNFCTSRFVVP